MKHILEVCLITATLVASSVACSARQNPEMQKGISVEMAGTMNAVSEPEADRAEAWIITLTNSGQIYFRTTAMTLDQLNEYMKAHTRNRTQKLYIKADARVPYARVEKVLEAGRAAFFETPVLLTAQQEQPQPGAIVPPKGLEVAVGSSFSSGAVATVVELPLEQERPLLKINNDQISWSELESTLKRHFQNGDDKVVLLRADARLPFAQVVLAVDRCHAAGAKVYLAEAGI